MKLKEMLLKVNKKYLIIYACVVAVFFTLLILMQVGVIGVSSESLGGRSSFDSTLTYYNGEHFYSTVALMSGETMLRYYLFHVCDYIFVITYYLMMAGLTYLASDGKMRKFAFLVPALTAIADIAENFSIDLLIFLYPARYAYADFVGVLSCIKWYWGAVWIAITLVLAGIKIYKYISAKKKKEIA